jgi:hypothetical protein
MRDDHINAHNYFTRSKLVKKRNNKIEEITVLSLDVKNSCLKYPSAEFKSVPMKTKVENAGSING